MAEDPPMGGGHAEALAVSELRYRRLFETAKDGILILDAESGVVVDVNPFLTGLLGFSREEVVGRAVWDLGFFKDAIASRDKFLELQRQTYVRYDNLPLEAADGQRCEVEFVSNVYLAGDTKVIQCNIRDITERRRLEAGLAESAAFVRTLMESIPAPVFFKDVEGRYLGVNKAFETFYGRPRDQVIGRSVFDIAPRDLAEVYHARDISLLQNPGTQVYETQMRDAANQMHDVMFHKATFSDSSGKVIGLVGVVLDITERVRAEEAHARLAMAVEQSAETIVITDDTASIVYANPAFEKISGYSLAEVMGKNPRVLKSGKQDADFYRRMWDVLGRGNVWHGRFINRRKDGALYEEEATISPVLDGRGRIANYVAAKRDVTREVQIQEQLRHAQKMESVGRLAGGVAHDFNNVLTAIMGYAELCRDRIGTLQPVRGWIDEILNGARRSADITSQLLAFARKQTIAPRVLDLNEAVGGMLGLLRRLIGEDISMAWRPAPHLWHVKLDPSQVDQMLANLCVNARDAISGTGRITLETSNVEIDTGYCAEHAEAAPGAFVMLAVTDDGCGMSPATLANVFEPFFTTKDVGKGTGLGLATVYGIVKQNNGFINVYSEPGTGSTFRIYLPCNSEGFANAGEAGAAKAPRGHGETILLVEDEKPLRVMCGLFLTEMGYDVVLADSPVHALDIAGRQAKSIRVLLTDVVMPGMDGGHLAQRVSAISPDVKVLFMSGYPADVVAGRDMIGPDAAFLAKPFSRDELAFKLRELLDDGGVARDAPGRRVHAEGD